MSAQPELHKEYPEDGEEELVEKLIPLLELLIEKDYITGTTYRDTHAKGHAAVRAEFSVDADLPDDLRVGLFKEPVAYPAWIRFSNLSPRPRADKKRDVRAMSIKLMSVPGPRLWQSEPDAQTLDFIMMSSQTFLSPNLATFCDLEVAIYKGGLSLLWFFVTHPRVALSILKGNRRTANLLEIPYYSQTAYAFGEKAVQYHIAPRQQPSSRMPGRPANNFLRERLREDLGRQERFFDFMVQFQTDPVRMPIENPMVPWSPELSPYRRVATIKILRQEFDSPAQMQFAENLSFSPWRTLPEHSPLGSVNRARLHVYPAISRFRHQRNNTVSKEPESGSPSL